MKITIALMLFSLAAAPAFAENALPPELLQPKSEKSKATLQDDPFSISTEDLDASESLNRVSGNVDRGFSSPEQSYVANNRDYTGPLSQDRPKV